LNDGEVEMYVALVCN